MTDQKLGEDGSAEDHIPFSIGRRCSETMLLQVSMIIMPVCSSGLNTQQECLSGLGRLAVL